MAAALVVGSWPTAAIASSDAQKFIFLFSGDPAQMLPGRVIAVGVVNASGSSQNIGHAENPDGTSTDTELLTMPDGTINFVDTLTSESLDRDPVSCVASYRAGGRYVVPSGTRRYASARGDGAFVGRGVIVFARNASGCSDDIAAAVFLFTATGRMTL